MVEMLMINGFVSLSVPELALCDSCSRMRINLLGRDRRAPRHRKTKQDDEEPFQAHLIYIVVLCPGIKSLRC